MHITVWSIYADHYRISEEALLLRLFRKSLAAEFQATSDINTFMRGNSTMSKLFDAYTKR